MSETLHVDPTSFRFACDMTALAPAERVAHQERIAQLFGSLVRERRALADGCAYRFDGEQYPLLATFISDERKCCPFLRFQLEVAPAQGPIWLQITGPGDIKPFLVEEFGHDETTR